MDTSQHYRVESNGNESLGATSRSTQDERQGPKVQAFSHEYDWSLRILLCENLKSILQGFMLRRQRFAKNMYQVMAEMVWSIKGQKRSRP